MNLFFVSSRFRRLTVPGALLVALLQRTPVLRVLGQAEAALVGSPVAQVLRAVITGIASLGAIQSMAGATPLVATPATASSGLSATVGTSVNVFYTVTGTLAPPQSWTIAGAVPPGLDFSGLTGPGTVNVQNLNLKGTPTTAGVYELTIRAHQGPSGSLTGSPVYNYTITVTGGATTTAPTISTQPASQTVTVGGNVTFSVTASGNPEPTYQWRRDGVAVGGATAASLTLNNVQAAQAGTYTVVVTNSAGSVTSNGAVLTVNPPAGNAPTITLQPRGHTVATGGSVVLSAAADDATSVRWQRNGVDVAGAIEATLLLRGLTAAQAGDYRLVATNATGSTTSAIATVAVTTVAQSEIGRVSNMSVRTLSDTGDKVLNVGFSVGGEGTAGTKSLLVRVIGPTLAEYGVGGTMADPTLTIAPLGVTTPIAVNDDWAGDAQIIATGASLGAFPLQNTASKDAIAIATVSNGPHTALAAGKNNTTGIVLTEIYDATVPATMTASTPRLVNVSARAQVGTGDGVLIAGFVVAGTTSKTLLIRASGPAIAAYGVSGTLANPKLTIHVLNGPKLFENDDWGGAPLLTSVGNSVFAFEIPDRSSKDAMLLVTLPPGGYTATVSGSDGGTGVALVEVYEVP